MSRRARLQAPAFEGLSEARIIAEAREVARRHGFARISMRNLGEKFGVSATALYYYFKNKEQLFEKVAHQIFAEISVSEASGSWQTQLRTYVLSYQARLLEYPGLARILLKDREAPSAMSWTESILAILHRAGFHDEHIWPPFGMLVFFINPMTLVDDNASLMDTNLFDPAVLNAMLRTDDDRYPNFARFMNTEQGAPSGRAMSYDALLPVVLDRIIADIERDPHRR